MPVTAFATCCRRALLGLALFPGLAMPADPVPAAPAMRLKSREVALASPKPGVRAEVQEFYTQKTGLEKARLCVSQVTSDKMAAMTRAFSPDNGRTWGAAEPVELLRKTPEGWLRLGQKAGWVDPVNGRLLVMMGQALLPTDHPLEGLSRGQLYYGVSLDGGRTLAVRELIQQAGEEFTPDHPLPGIWLGRNNASYGDRTGRPIRTRAGLVLQPVQLTLPGKDGQPANPGGGYTYMESAVLMGTWNAEATRLSWRLSERVAHDPAQSSRGAFEPTIAELPDGRILMLMRGSSTKTTPGRRWFSLSADGGATWSAIQPWTYTDGTSFYSPSSTSQLVQHSNGRLYWFGNLVAKPPTGNNPRYPMVAGLVDPASGLLVKDSVVVLDDLAPGENPKMMLSNFQVHEDRETQELLLHMSRPFADGTWTSDAYCYRLIVSP